MLKNNFVQVIISQWSEQFSTIVSLKTLKKKQKDFERSSTSSISTLSRNEAKK